MKFFNKKIILALIIVLAFVLRFWRLDSYPALNADEAAIGYNAYSLIQTELDEHGHSWPIHFQSFNDYKPGLYFYIVLPFVKFIGLNEWAVRIPGAFLGVLTVLVIYLLISELFKKDNFALFSALFLAISPWHIQFSRGGWEVNVATFLITTGVWLFVKFVNSKHKLYLFLSLLSFALSLYCYHAARIVSPLLGLGLIILFKKEIFFKQNIKLLVTSFLFLILLLTPLAHDLTSSDVLSRAAGVGLFADLGPINRINEQRGEYNNSNSLVAKLLHNKAVNYGLAFMENWSAHYNGEFLFLTGDVIQRNRVPEMGEMYLFDILFLFIGCLYMSKDIRKEWILIFFWLATAPIAAALTFQAPHALRAQNMVIPMVIISAYGAAKLFTLLQEKKLKVLILTLVVLMVWLFARYQELYWVHMAKELPFSSQYGVKELVDYVKTQDAKYQNVIVTDKYDQPYILFLFYLNYSPTKFQTSHVLTPRDKFGFSTVRNFDKFHFDGINFDKMQKDFPNSLIIGAPNEISQDKNIIKRIYGTNGYEYFDVVEN